MIQNGNMDQPYVIPTTVSGKYIVPMYEPITYDALTGGSDPTCGGYFNISKAYGYDGGNGSLNPFKCGTKFAERPCSGRVEENYGRRFREHYGNTGSRMGSDPKGSAFSISSNNADGYDVVIQTDSGQVLGSFTTYGARASHLFTIPVGIDTLYFLVNGNFVRQFNPKGGVTYNFELNVDTNPMRKDGPFYFNISEHY
jgi:hypothetical protein